MLHRLCEPPSILLSFSLAAVLPRRGTYCVSSGREIIKTPLLSAHRLRLGLPGYLIPFDPLAFAHSASVTGQRAAFAAGVPSDIYAFHRSTRSSTLPFRTLALQYQMLFFR